MPAVTRVTYVSYDDSPPEGGQGVELAGMRDVVSARGVTVTTISGRGDNAVTYSRRTGRRPLDFSAHINGHRESIDATDPDVIHALGGPGGVLITRSLSRPLIYTANHTYRQAYSRWSLRRSLGLAEARAYKRASRVLAISTATAEAVRAMGVPGAHIEVLAPGIDVPADIDHGVRDPNFVLFVGRLERHKGVLDAIRVVDAMSSRFSEIHACIVGTGSLIEEVRARARVSRAPIDVAGRLTDAEVRDLYRRAALVLMPSDYEGLGLVAAEAIAHGASVAGYDVDGLRDIVPTSGGGQLVLRGAVVPLASAASDLLVNYDRAQAESARRWLAEHYSWTAVGDRLIEVYNSVV